MTGNRMDIAALGEVRDGTFHFRQEYTLPGGETIRQIRLPENLPPGITPEAVVEGFLESCAGSSDTGLAIDGHPVYVTDVRIRPVPESPEVRSQGL
jgi:hypothetical protein